MSNKESLRTVFKELNAALGVSGHEQDVARLIIEQIKDHADEVSISNTGNIVATKKGNKPGPTVAVVAHMDEVGYVVRNILPSGFIKLDKVGTAPDGVATGRTVWISSKKIPGVIGTKPGHLQTPEEARAVVPIGRCFVDVGVSSAEEAKALGIKIGDQVVIQQPYVEMSNTDLICTRAIDDRIGCAIIVELIKNLKKEDFAGTLLATFTVREEVGLIGARNALFNYDVDYSIAIDTIPVADTPDYNAANDLPIYMGKGPGFPVLEAYPAAVGMWHLIHPGVREFIENVAAEQKINLQTMTLAFAGYLTDATSLAYVKDGVPTGVLAIPRRYSHSPVELFNINDAVDVHTMLHNMLVNNDKIKLSFI